MSNLIRLTLPTDDAGSIGNQFVDVRLPIEAIDSVRLSMMATVTLAINNNLRCLNWRESADGRQHLESLPCGEQDANAERQAEREAAIRTGIEAVELMTDAIIAAGWKPVGPIDDHASEVVIHYGDALYMRNNRGDGFPADGLLAVHHDATQRHRNAIHFR